MTILLLRRTGRPLLSSCFMLLILGAVGCSGAKGDLSGKVSYQGKLLVYGSVLFIGADAKPRTTWIQTDGSYHFDDVPVGEAKLAVYSPDPAQQRRQAERRSSGRKKPVSKDKPAEPELPAVDRTKWFAIPAEYGDVDHSGLRVTINRGPNTYHIDMK